MTRRSQMVDNDLIHFRCRFDIAFLFRLLRVTRVKQIIDEIIGDEAWNS